MATRIEADQLIALTQRFELFIPHSDRRSQGVEQQQRRRARSRRVLDSQLDILGSDQFHSSPPTCSRIASSYNKSTPGPPAGVSAKKSPARSGAFHGAGA